jgi:hypothetical protein
MVLRVSHLAGGVEAVSSGVSQTNSALYDPGGNSILTG